MTLLLRMLERVHGHLGWLAVVALLHPAILLRNPRRQARLSVILATLTAVITGSLGMFVYPHYRRLLKQRLFMEAPRIGWMFERKEHLAVGALAFALIGCVMHLATPNFEGEGARREAARSAHAAFVAAFVFACAVGVLGVVVAARKSF